MKNGLELEAPVAKETGRAINLVLKALAATIVMYGVAKVIIAVGTLVK
ncbi:Uncharacterised protein [Escherichia coli]|nr:hypothetical protein [Escherichia coli]CAD6175882.1 Uncharacterised protein [Escherichia coli]